MRKIYTAIAMTLFALGSFANQGISTEFVSNSAQAQVSETLGTDFLEFTITDQVTSTINAVDHTVSVTMPAGTDLSSLIADFTLSTGASAWVNGVQVSPTVDALDYTSAVTFTVENGTESQDWTVTAIAAVKVTFNVDMTLANLVEGDVVYVTGSFNGWNEPGTGASILMTKGEGNIWTGSVYLPENSGEIKYKYFKNATWANGDPYNGGTDRALTVADADLTTADIWAQEIVKVTFVVDATLANLVDGDVIYLTGDFADWNEPGTGKSILMTAAADNMWKTTVIFPKNFGDIKYKYFKNAGWDNGDEVGDKTLTIADANITTADVWKLVSVNENALSLVSMYPNPVNNLLTIANLEGVNKVVVSNLLGQALVTKNVTNATMEINTADFKAGIYVVTLVSESGLTRSERIVKE